MLRARRELQYMHLATGTSSTTLLAYEVQTFQSIDSPSLEFCKRDLCGGWQDVEVELMVIVLLLKLCICELPLLVVKIGASLGIDSRVIVADHGAGSVHFWCVAGFRTFQCW